MVKLSFENMGVKLGKPIDPKTMTSLTLKNAQIDDLGTFERFAALENVDLSSNRFCFQRQLTGLFAAKATITNVNLTGNPVCSSANYRLFMIYNLPSLQILDNVEVTEEERKLADSVVGRSESVTAAPSVRAGLQEEEAEIAELNEAQARNKTELARKKEEERLEKQRLYEEDRAEAERIAALLGAPTGTTNIEEESAAPSAKDIEKANKEKAKQAEKERKAELAAQEKAKAAEEKAKAAEEKAKAAEEKAQKIAEEKKKQREAKEQAEAQAKAQAEAQKAAKAEKTTSSNPPAVAKATAAPPPKEVHGATFQDTRSGLTISTTLSDAERQVQEPAPAPVAPKRKLATEESLFGDDSASRELDFLKIPSTGVSKGLFEDDDDELFARASKSMVQKKTAAKPTASATKSSDDDLFAMLGSSGAASKPSKGTDDLFAMLTPAKSTSSTAAAAKPKSSIESAGFNIESFISNTKSSQGGLFDD